MFRVFRTYGELDAYLAQRKRDFPWKLAAIGIFALILLAVGVIAGWPM